MNKTVAKLLDKLLVEFTQSRARTNDNALVEGKNGVVVRKHLGYPEVIVDAKGKQRKRYPYERMMAPYEKIKSLPNAERFLKPGVTFEQLHALALQMSDNEAATTVTQGAPTTLSTHP